MLIWPMNLTPVKYSLTARTVRSTVPHGICELLRTWFSMGSNRSPSHLLNLSIQIYIWDLGYLLFSVMQLVGLVNSESLVLVLETKPEARRLTFSRFIIAHVTRMTSNHGSKPHCHNQHNLPNRRISLVNLRRKTPAWGASLMLTVKSQRMMSLPKQPHTL